MPTNPLVITATPIAANIKASNHGTRKFFSSASQNATIASVTRK